MTLNHNEKRQTIFDLTEQGLDAKKLKVNCKFVKSANILNKNRLQVESHLKTWAGKWFKQRNAKTKTWRTKFLMKNCLVQFVQFLEILTKIFQQYSDTQQFTLGEFNDYNVYCCIIYFKESALQILSILTQIGPSCSRWNAYVSYTLMDKIDRKHHLSN